MCAPVGSRASAPWGAGRAAVPRLGSRRLALRSSPVRGPRAARPVEPQFELACGAVPSLLPPGPRDTWRIPPGYGTRSRAEPAARSAGAHGRPCRARLLAVSSLHRSTAGRAPAKAWHIGMEDAVELGRERSACGWWWCCCPRCPGVPRHLRGGSRRERIEIDWRWNGIALPPLRITLVLATCR